MPGRVWEQAYEVALDQFGFITFENMREMGADPARLRRWYHAGKIDRKGHGIYRFRQVPATELDPYMLATLWPSGSGILSHETALELHGLCDVNPDKIHICVAPKYRPRRKGGEEYILHFEQPGRSEIAWHEGIRIVTPAKGISQAVAWKTPTHLIRQAIDNAARLGRVPTEELHQLKVLLKERR